MHSDCCTRQCRSVELATRVLLHHGTWGSFLSDFVVVERMLGKIQNLKLEPSFFLPVFQMKPGSTDVKFTAAPNEEHTMKEV